MRRPLSIALGVACAVALPSVCAGTFASPVQAQAKPVENARALLDRVRELNDGERAWRDRTQRLQLEIVDRRGYTRHREMEILSKKYGDDDSRSILFFLAPAEVRGIGLLQWIQSAEPDRQWLYLPELKRVRQITGSSKRESFAGTDFSFEDLAIMGEALNWTEKDAHAELRGDEEIDGETCAVIEQVPKSEADVSYAKIRLWLGRDDLVVHKYEFEDGKGAVAKTLTLADYRQVGKVPAAYRMEMANARAHSTTKVEFTDIRFDTGLPDETFSQRRLESGI